MSGLIDAYAHCGLSKYKPLSKVEQAMQLAGVDRAVLVQHLGEFDNAYIQQVVADSPQKFSGVLLVDHEQQDASARLHEWEQTGHFRGVRFLLESLQSNPALWQAAVDRDLNIIVYDPDGLAQGADLLSRVLERNPTARLVLSHLGGPDLANDPEFIQHDSIFRLSEHPGAYFQVSGFHMFCPYPYDEVRPLIRKALDTFGPDRMLWGGNYPVVGDDESYARELALVRSGTFEIPPEAVTQVVHDTADSIWFSR